MFATKNGNIRRNDFSDFHNIQSNGKIAMKLDENDALIGVKLCNENEHVLLAAESGKCVRFPVSAVRVFKSRTSDGVRGIKLSDDNVVSLSILSGPEFETDERDVYLKIDLEQRLRIKNAPTHEEKLAIANSLESELDKETIIRFANMEEFILTITENGFGKRTSAYEYRVTNRGGSGIVNIITAGKNGKVVSSFPISAEDHIMIITDQGTVLRSTVNAIRVQGRNTKGVIIQRTSESERVVSVAKIMESDEEEVSEEGGEEI
jgi:DNA gyrase subunit A